MPQLLFAKESVNGLGLMNEWRRSEEGRRGLSSVGKTKFTIHRTKSFVKFSYLNELCNRPKMLLGAANFNEELADKDRLGHVDRR